MAKEKEAPGTALAVVDTSGYLALSAGDEVREAMEENLAGETLNEYDLTRIKIPAGGAQAWAIPTLDGEEYVKSFEGIVLSVKQRRAYYASTETTGEAPDCYSNDMVKGLGEPGGDCAECPLNQWESGKHGRGKACKEMRHLYVLLPISMLPVVVVLPPTSIKPWKQYSMKMAGANKPISTVVTRFSLAKATSDGGNDYSYAVFEYAGQLPEADRPKVKAVAGLLK